MVSRALQNCPTGYRIGDPLRCPFSGTTFCVLILIQSNRRWVGGLLWHRMSWHCAGKGCHCSEMHGTIVALGRCIKWSIRAFFCRLGFALASNLIFRFPQWSFLRRKSWHLALQRMSWHFAATFVATLPSKVCRLRSNWHAHQAVMNAV